MSTDQFSDQRQFEDIRRNLLQMEASRVKNSNYSISPIIFEEGQMVPAPRLEVRIQRPTIIVFADDAPLYNWAHPCRYLLHDAESGELYSEIGGQFPPINNRNRESVFIPFHEPVVHAKPNYFPVFSYPVWRYRFTGERYAILFSGMSNNRHTNDLEFAYRTLINVYGYKTGNVLVLQYDGTKDYDSNTPPTDIWPGDNTPYIMPVDGKGTSENLLQALDHMKSILEPEDSLFIHTNNHGGHDSEESYICCYPDYSGLGVTAFVNKLATLPRYSCLTIMMEQCFSGGFGNAVIAKSTADRTNFAAACTEFNSSIGGADFDPFARDWIAAMAGMDPYGYSLHTNPDSNNNGRVSAKEAFDYANSIHDPYDTPLYHSVNGGSGCWLGEDIFAPVYTVRPGLLQNIILRHWHDPDPGPEEIQRRLKEMLPELTRAHDNLKSRAFQSSDEIENRLTQIIQDAARR